MSSVIDKKTCIQDFYLSTPHDLPDHAFGFKGDGLCIRQRM